MLMVRVCVCMYRSVTTHACQVCLHSCAVVSKITGNNSFFFFFSHRTRAYVFPFSLSVKTVLYIDSGICFLSQVKGK